MQLEITAKNIELSPQVRRHIEGKLGKLGRHLASISEARLEIAEERTRSPQHRFIAQLTIDSNGTLLRGEQRGENLLTAIDKVAEIMDRQIRRYKGKLYHKGRGNSPARGRSKYQPACRIGSGRLPGALGSQGVSPRAPEPSTGQEVSAASVVIS